MFFSRQSQEQTVPNMGSAGKLTLRGMLLRLRQTSTATAKANAQSSNSVNQDISKMGPVAMIRRDRNVFAILSHTLFPR
jgi:hypothetical protein